MKLSEGSPQELAERFDGKIFYLDREPTSQLVEQINRVDRVAGRRSGTGLYISIG